MAKVSGSYPSVIMGVSQQVPQDRRPGQNYDQDNMISDPVRGLSRRHGSLLDGETILGPRDPAFDAATLLDTVDYKEFTFFVGPREFTLLYRTKPRPTNSQAPALIVYDKDNHTFLPVTEGGGALLDTLKQNGVAAVVNVGRFLYLAANSFSPTRTTTPLWSDRGNTKRGLIWIRTGAYSRTYKVTMRTEIGVVEAEYATPQSSYPGTLDTSDIPTSDPDYQKKVTDRQSAYQTAVTQWIGTAAAAIQPESIAENLMLALQAQVSTVLGWPTYAVGRVDSSVNVWAPSGESGFPDDTLVDIIVDDGGDGNAAWAVGNEVAEVARLSSKHSVGKIVRIRPKKASEEDAYYMKAVPRIAGTGPLVWSEVTWVEAAGTETTPDQVFCFATVEGNQFHVAGTAQDLEDSSTVETPGFSPSAVGDIVTSPVPFLFGKQITYMGLIQDRLLIAAGSVLFMSRPGDYLNWWRKSVLTVDDSDPIEIFALGAEDDIIQAGTTYDRSLLLFGQRKQYIINGRNTLTPQSASVVVMSSYEDAVQANPQNSSNFVFYAKSKAGFTSMHQVQTGIVAEAPETYEISQQLDTYLVGQPVQILPIMAPNTLFIRTTGSRNLVYVYTYLDSPDGGQRLFDSWSRWSWNPILGHCLGMTYNDGDVLIFTLRSSPDPDTGEPRWWAVADRFSMSTELSSRPYVDSTRLWTDYLDGEGSLRSTWAEGQAECLAAIGKGGRRQFLGTTAENLSALATEFPEEASNIWVGADYSDLTYVTPTNPYIRDQQGKAIINGRLTVTRYSVSVADSGGLQAFVSTPSRGEFQVLDWSGRTLGRLSSEIGIQPISTGAVPIPVGRETREFRYRIKAKTWLPLTLTAVEWTGQLFYNQRRV